MSRKIIGITVGTPISAAKIWQELKPEIKEYIDERIGDIETALDTAIALCDSYINGGAK